MTKRETCDRFDGDFCDPRDLTRNLPPWVEIQSAPIEHPTESDCDCCPCWKEKETTDENS